MRVQKKVQDREMQLRGFDYSRDSKLNSSKKETKAS